MRNFSIQSLNDERRMDQLYDAICSDISECDENHSQVISETNVVDALKHMKNDKVMDMMD